MSFLIPCPCCGPRDVSEFRFGGEKVSRPPNPGEVSPTAWGHYVHDRKNVDGAQTEWWYHRSGCGAWFLAVRNTVTNTVEKSWVPERKPA